LQGSLSPHSGTTATLFAALKVQHRPSEWLLRGALASVPDMAQGGTEARLS